MVYIAWRLIHFALVPVIMMDKIGVYPSVKLSDSIAQSIRVSVVSTYTLLEPVSKGS